MMDKKVREKIECRAFEIFEWRQANGIVGSHYDDWFQAEAEITIDRRQIEGCPTCGYNFLARHDDEIACLRNGCSWKIMARRKSDQDKPAMGDIKKDWG